MIGVVARILLRVAAGVMIGRGWLSADDGATLSTDPDVMHLVEGAIGAVVWSATEVYYYLAKRYGWTT